MTSLPKAREITAGAVVNGGQQTTFRMEAVRMGKNRRGRLLRFIMYLIIAVPVMACMTPKAC